MAIRKRLKQLHELALSEWRVLLLSMLLLPLIALSLRVKGLKWTRDMLANRVPSGHKTTITKSEQLRRAQSVARMVSVAANHGLYRTNCLKISLLSWWLLQRQGITTSLVIGVNKDNGDLNAHAWVEYQGTVLTDKDNVGEQFAAFGSS